MVKKHLTSLVRTTAYPFSRTVMKLFRTKMKDKTDKKEKKNLQKAWTCVRLQVTLKDSRLYSMISILAFKLDILFVCNFEIGNLVSKHINTYFELLVKAWE